MNYQLTLNIAEDSAANRNIESVAKAEHLSREEAALKLIEAIPKRGANASGGTNASARRILGAFKEEAVLMDEALEIALQDRQQRNGS